MPAFLATPLAKLAFSLGLVALLSGAYFAWKYHQQSIGYERHQREVVEELLQQKEEALGHYLVQEKQKELLEYTVVRQKDRVHEKLRKNYQDLLQREQHDTTSTPICMVDPELVASVNDLGRLLDSVSQGDTTSATGSPDEPVVRGGRRTH